jgi:hypothetical protein
MDDIVAMDHMAGHWRHFDADKIVRNDLHIVLVDRAADIEFPRHDRPAQHESGNEGAHGG